jgi:hypothetical protein
MPGTATAYSWNSAATTWKPLDGKVSRTTNSVATPKSRLPRSSRSAGLRDLAEAFTQHGGLRSEAEAAWRAHKTQKATEAAIHADEFARSFQAAETRARL